jgi:hypothetical protein
VIVAVSGLAVDGLVVAHAEDGDDCYEDGHDEYGKGKVLRWRERYVVV